MTDLEQTLTKELEDLQAAYDKMADRLEEALLTNGKLRLLLNEKGIDHEY